MATKGRTRMSLEEYDERFSHFIELYKTRALNDDNVEVSLLAKKAKLPSCKASYDNYAKKYLSGMSIKDIYEMHYGRDLNTTPKALRIEDCDNIDQVTDCLKRSVDFLIDQAIQRINELLNNYNNGLSN